ncbi:MAG: hypothetical protein ABJ364_08490, partial [Lentilitoribacter sp.]
MTPVSLVEIWMIDESTWRILRPYVNLFIARRTMRELLGNSANPNLYFDGLPSQVCELRGE